MTLEDQIRDEKVQYDINREAAKISALSSGKTGKYEYLTGEETLPSNQQQIIEQAKFTYSHLRKTFEKQIKTSEDQGEKQIKSIQNIDFNKSIKKSKFDSDDDLAILRQKDLYTSVNRNKDKLIYKYKGNTSNVNFNEYIGAIDLINKIKDGDVSLKQAINDQDKLKSKLGDIKKGNSKGKSRQAATDFFVEYTERVSEGRYRSKQEGTGLKILTPKQMFQRLPISLAPIKAGNISQSLLNEIRQIVYCLYQSKEITKKVDNDILKSIKV